MPYKEGSGHRAHVMWKGERHQQLCRTKKEAVEWEVAKRKELKENEKLQQLGMDLLTFCTKYLDESEKFVPRTYQEKQSLTRRILKCWGPDTPVLEITPEKIDSYLKSRAKYGNKKQKSHKLSSSGNAMNKDRKNLMAMWNWGIRILDSMKRMENPVQDIERRPHDRKTQYVPPPEDVFKVLAAATKEERVFLSCYLHTAARRSEIFHLTWSDDINLEQRLIRLGSRKNRSGDMIYEWMPMNEELHKSLAWWWKNRPVRNAVHVFVHDDPLHTNYGKPYTQRRRILRSLCKRAGVRYFSYHALRRFVASVLADRHKVSSKQIQRFLRHKNLRTTELYIHSLTDDLRQTADLLSETNLPEGFTRKGMGVGTENS